MNRPLGFPNGVFVNDPSPASAIYYRNFNQTSGWAPYTSVADVRSQVVAGLRYKGLTVNVNGVEYWFKDGITDGDLVLKVQAASSGLTRRTVAQLNTLIGLGTLDLNTLYYCTDATDGSSTVQILLTAFASDELNDGAFDISNGVPGTYEAGTGIFTGSSGGGTVTSFSAPDANGFDLTVTNPTTTPSLDIKVSPSGILKGSSGALASALSADVIASLGYTPENVANKATNFTVLNNTLYTTTQAVATYVAGLVSGLLDLRGGYDASSNLFPSTGGSGTAGAILKGDFWYVLVAGTLGGTDVVPGQSFFANVDTPGQTDANWTIMPLAATPTLEQVLAANAYNAYQSIIGGEFLKADDNNVAVLRNAQTSPDSAGNILIYINSANELELRSPDGSMVATFSNDIWTVSAGNIQATLNNTTANRHFRVVGNGGDDYFDLNFDIHQLRWTLADSGSVEWGSNYGTFANVVLQYASDLGPFSDRQIPDMGNVKAQIALGFQNVSLGEWTTLVGANGLVPGRRYRIASAYAFDYFGSKDIIVTADSVNTIETTASVVFGDKLVPYTTVVNFSDPGLFLECASEMALDPNAVLGYSGFNWKFSAGLPIFLLLNNGLIVQANISGDDVATLVFTNCKALTSVTPVVSGYLGTYVPETLVDEGDEYFYRTEAYRLDSESQPNTISTLAAGFNTGTGAIRNVIGPYANVIDVGENFTDNTLGEGASVTRDATPGNGINANVFGSGSVVVMGDGCNQNEIGASTNVIFGTGAQNNSIGVGSNSFIFGNNLRNVTVLAGTVGLDLTSSDIYNKDYQITIFRASDNNLYQQYYDGSGIVTTALP